MISKKLKIAAALSVFAACNNASAAFDTLCFFGTNDGIGPTMWHIIDWNVLDMTIWNRGVSETSVVPPPGVTVQNNPRVDTYFLAAEGLEYSAGVLPPPIPSGLWSIQGSTVVMFWTLWPFQVSTHPDSPFTCSSIDFVL